MNSLRSPLCFLCFYAKGQPQQTIDNALEKWQIKRKKKKKTATRSLTLNKNQKIPASLLSTPKKMVCQKIKKERR